MGQQQTRTDTSSPTGDLQARRVNGVTSVVFAFLITVLGSVDSLDLPVLYVWFAGTCWLPLTVWMLLREDVDPPEWLGMARLVLDVAMMMATLILVPDSQATIGYLLIPVILVITYQRGVVIGVVVTLLGLVARLGPLAGNLDSENALRVMAATIVMFLLIIATGLVRRTLERSAARVSQVSNRSALIARYSTEGIVITDGSGTVLEANPAAQTLLFDGADAGAIVGETCRDSLTFVTGSSVELDCSTGCALAALCGSGESGGDRSVEVYRTTADGRVPLIASAVELPGEEGRHEYLHSFRDITRLKEADEAKTMFLATASHELKTPLTVIRGFTQLLQSRAVDEQDVVALDAIAARSLELSEIVDRLLLSSRIDAGRVELSLEPHDITSLLRSRLADANSSLGRDITLQTKEDVWALVSDTALDTVIDHLVDNAVKYSPDGGGVRVELTTSKTRSIVRVTDSGIGMSPEQVDRCFEKFWQGEVTDVRRFGGTGIGLYIVHSLVTGMRGRISVESTRGQGTTFTIRLPRVHPPSESDLDVQVPIGPSLAERSAPKGSVDEFIQQLGIGVGGR